MNKHAIKSGLLVGVIGIVITLIIYLVDPTLLASGWLGLAFMIIFSGLISYFGIQHRNEIGGFMSFGKAWIYSFQTFMMGAIIAVLFNILLYNVIDSELATIVADQMVENQSSTMRSFGMPEDQIEEQMDTLRESSLDQYSIVGQLKGLLIISIIYAILSLITGAIVKKKEPEFEG